MNEQYLEVGIITSILRRTNGGSVGLNGSGMFQNYLVSEWRLKPRLFYTKLQGEGDIQVLLNIGAWMKDRTIFTKVMAFSRLLHALQ